MKCSSDCSRKIIHCFEETIQYILDNNPEFFLTNVGKKTKKNVLELGNKLVKKGEIIYLDDSIFGDFSCFVLSILSSKLKKELEKENNKEIKKVVDGIDHLLDKKLDLIFAKYEGHIESRSDLLGDYGPSPLFYIMADRFSYLLDDNPDKVLSEKSVIVRRQINKVIKLVGGAFLSSKQVFEDRDKLVPSEIDDKSYLMATDLPKDQPVIFAPNHGFKDDALCSVLAADRHAYFLFGSLPVFYNTMDGFVAWINGVLLINRKNQNSRKSITEKCEKAHDLGLSLIYYAEGVWNKSPNLLVLNLWPGIVRIAKKCDYGVVPMIHYKKELHLLEKDDYIHTIVDNMINFSNTPEKEAIQQLRDKMATWVYLMMEKYCTSTDKDGKTNHFVSRDDLISGYSDANDYWEAMVRKRVAPVRKFYDSEIETSAEYLTKPDQEQLEIEKEKGLVKTSRKRFQRGI